MTGRRGRRPGHWIENHSSLAESHDLFDFSKVGMVGIPNMYIYIYIYVICML